MHPILDPIFPGPRFLQKYCETRSNSYFTKCCEMFENRYFKNCETRVQIVKQTSRPRILKSAPKKKTMVHNIIAIRTLWSTRPDHVPMHIRYQGCYNLTKVFESLTWCF